MVVDRGGGGGISLHIGLSHPHLNDACAHVLSGDEGADSGRSEQANVVGGGSRDGKRVSATPAHLSRQIANTHESTPATTSGTTHKTISDDTPSAGVSGTPTGQSSKGRRTLAFATPTDSRLGSSARPGAPVVKATRGIMGN